MPHKLGSFIIVLALTVSAAAEHSASISGYVRNSAGTPQMGALVEVLSSASQAVHAFTDENGFYSIRAISPGFYNLRVSAPSFIPVLKEHLGLRAGSTVALNITLTTLFEAIQFAPARTSADNDDDWKWVLRSASNRSVLRLVDDNNAQPQIAENGKHDHDFKGGLSLVAGSASDGFGASELGTGFQVERAIFNSGMVSLDGNLGYTSGTPAGILRASYSHALGDGSNPTIALTMRSLPTPDGSMRNEALQSYALTTSDSLKLGDLVALSFGSELQTIQFMGRVTAFRPFGSADVRLSPGTVLEYRYATSEPDTMPEAGFDSTPADFTESGPRVSMAGFNSTVERAHHHEVSLSHHEGNTTVQAAVYFDRISDPALTGVGEFSTDDGNVLPDLYSGTFTYRGSNLDTRGIRLVMEEKITGDLVASVDYAYGGVLSLGEPDAVLDEARKTIETKDRATVAGKVKGTVPKAKTHWIASYRWINGPALTPVDMFNVSPGQASPYLGLLIRQPIPFGFLPCKMEALLDMRNLLAQGYVPVRASDGHTVYLVQSARAVRGGLAFIF